MKLLEEGLRGTPSKDYSDEVRWHETLEKYRDAQNPNTPVKKLEQLANDEDYYVRWCVAQNLNTPPKTLEQLATDEDSAVRCGVAENPNTSPKTLEQLATDEYFDVRYRVALNPNCPHYIKKYFNIRNQLRTLQQLPTSTLKISSDSVMIQLS
jgi:hypothetical protein